MILKKSVPVFILVALQFGCAEQQVYQNPAPVHRGKAHARVKQAPEKLVEVFKYPEAAEISVQPHTAEIPSEHIAPVTQDQHNAPEPHSVSMPPAILALVTEAEQNLQMGNFESAAVKIERALRIDSRNADLTYKLANIRLKQEQPRLAEDLAKKAELLAEGNRDLKRRCWLLIAESKRLQNDPQGAQQAEQKAAQI